MVYSQDAIFSQYFATPLYLNPAFAGSSEYTRISTSYRNEWPVYKAFSTYYLSFDQPVDILHGGLGLVVTNDMLGGGTYNNLGVSGIYSSEVLIGKHITAWGGISASIGHQSFNTNKLEFPGEISPLSNPGSEHVSGHSTWYPDFSLGILTSIYDYYAGMAVHHLLSPSRNRSSSGNNKLNRKYTIHVGRYIATNSVIFGRDRLYVSPNLLLQLQEGNFQQLNYGIYLEQSPVTLGIWMRQNINFGISAFIVSMGLGQDNWQVGYSYDIFLNRYENFLKSGAHEVTFSLKFQYTSKRKKRGAIKCPKF